MLEVQNISLQVGDFQLTNINFRVEQGEYFVILGVSGVGKSILLESLAGLLTPNSGKILLRGKDISTEKIQKRNLSIVYQDSDLFPHLSAYENIAYPLKSKKEKNIRERILQAAEKTGIAHKLDRKPQTLSGGEYQRVALARSLAAGSDIFLLDEPLSSLDTKSRNDLRALLRTLNRSGITILHVTHDYEEAIALASKIGVMENGQMVHVDTPEEFFKHPRSEFVAHFIGIKNFFMGALASLPENDLKEFRTNGLTFFCLTEAADGEAFLTLRPEEITISQEQDKSSSRNHFYGIITDIAPARVGLEVTVDIGTKINILISSDARKSLRLAVGKEVWINFKASSCKIYNS